MKKNMPLGNFTKVLSVVLILLTLLFIVFGSVLPFIKSRSYIKYLNAASAARTMQEFKSAAQSSLDLVSPVGQEEVTKYVLSGIREILQAHKVPLPVAEELVRFIEPYAFKDDVRHLAAMGDLYTLLWARYGDEAAYGSAVEYYKDALKIGPNLPPMLYALLELYAYKKDLENEKEIANIILKNWPNDEGVRGIIASSTPVKN